MVEKTEYRTKNVRGEEFPDTINIEGRKYIRKEALRYGDNPHQAAAIYVPEDRNLLVVGDYKELKTGKGGLSRTNVFDMDHAYNILKYFDTPGCAVMKHLNASGVAVYRDKIRENLRDIYLDARDGDPVAAFGGVVGFNHTVDRDTAEELMRTFIECVVAPEYEEGVMDIFERTQKAGRGLNKDIRVVRVDNISRLAKFRGDDVGDYREAAYLSDGSVVLQEPYLSIFRGPEDLQVKTIAVPTPEDYKDMEFMWRVIAHTRSNGVGIGGRGRTYGIGTGKQDRLSATRDALETAVRGILLRDGDGMVTLGLLIHDSDVNKENAPYKFTHGVMTGRLNLQKVAELDPDFRDLTLASDGFYPEPSGLELGGDFYATSVIQPGGSQRDNDVIDAANRRGMKMAFPPERAFAHF